MSGSGGLAAFLAFLVAVSGFAGLSVSTPAGYPQDSLLEEGLVKEIMFDEAEFFSPCLVRGELILLNPSNADVVVDVENPVNWQVFSENENPW
jgi:hypothetical protein